MGINFGFLPTVQAYGGIDQVWAISDAQYALSNKVGPNTTPAELGALGAMDKKLSIAKAQAQLRYDYSVAEEEANRALYKKNAQRHEQHIQNGWLF